MEWVACWNLCGSLLSLLSHLSGGGGIKSPSCTLYHGYASATELYATNKFICAHALTDTSALAALLMRKRLCVCSKTHVCTHRQKGERTELFQQKNNILMQTDIIKNTHCILKKYTHTYTRILIKRLCWLRELWELRKGTILVGNVVWQGM